MENNELWTNDDVQKLDRLIDKKECCYDATGKIVFLRLYKLWKAQKPEREWKQKQEEKQALMDMNS